MSSTGAGSYRPSMVPNATKTDWQQGQDALREEVGRVTTLLRSIDDPLPPAVGQWNLGEVAMHLSQAWGGVSGLARQDAVRRVGAQSHRRGRRCATAEHRGTGRDDRPRGEIRP